MEMVTKLYQYTDAFPRDEIFGITQQMRRAAISIPSNIAEGVRRRTEREVCRYMRMAYGSASELETQLLISQALKFGDLALNAEVHQLLIRVLQMLNRYIQRMSTYSKD